MCIHLYSRSYLLTLINLCLYLSCLYMIHVFKCFYYREYEQIGGGAVVVGGVKAVLVHAVNMRNPKLSKKV